MTTRRLDGKTALVTGASSGIGAALARELAREGANLVLTARRQDRLQALAQELTESHDVHVSVEAVDLGAPGAAAIVEERTEGAGVAIDVLVNNAGFGLYEPFAAAPWERYAQMLTLNVVALTELTHRMVPHMIARGRGWVMNVASIGAYLPTPTFAVYGASKAYVRNFTEALRYELRGTGVRAIAVCPGATQSEFTLVAGQTLLPSAERWLMSAEKCAAIAVRKMLAGRATVVTGSVNALGMWLLRLLPRALMPGLAFRFLSGSVARAPALDGPSSPEDGPKELGAPRPPDER